MKAALSFASFIAVFAAAPEQVCAIASRAVRIHVAALPILQMTRALEDVARVPYANVES